MAWTGLSTWLHTRAVRKHKHQMLLCLGFAGTGRARPPLLDAALLVVATAAVAVTVVGVASLARGHRPAEVATHVGYLLATATILPVTAGSMRHDRGRWSSAAFAVGCLVVALMLVRVSRPRA